MGINTTSYPLLINELNKYNKDKKETVLVELGIQENYTNNTYLRDELSSQYKEYISVDLHELSNVTICDLSIYQPKKFNCDILTNFGTTEHVEYEDGQYNCWLNVHSWLNVDGIAIHEIPKTGHWPNHCRYYCDHSFFNEFTKLGYEILELRDTIYSPGNLVWCVMKKVKEMDFMDKETFFKYMTIDKNTPLSKININNNPKRLI
jgi:hypothetical protein